MASLTVTQGPAEQLGKQFVLKQRPLAGGRHPSQEIQLVDPEVSRRHFLIRPDGDTHVISETQSVNGIFVNGQKAKSHQLKEGDIIRVGKTTLVYSQLDESDIADAVQGQRRADKDVRERGTLHGE